MNQFRAAKWLALAGLTLTALNLRSAVSSLSPVIDFVRESYELSTLTVSVLGMLAPLCFALGGLIAPSLTRRIGLEAALIALLVTITLGHLVRALSLDSSFLSLGTLIALLGTGVGNVLLPVVVRKYFADRVATMTAVYLTVMSVSAFLPPLIAVPVAEFADWRYSLGQWALVALIAVVPWIFDLGRNRIEEPLVTQSLELPTNRKEIRIWKSPTAIAMVVIWAVSAMTGYSMFAWLPQILIDESGSTAFEAGILLSLFAAMGLPAALVMPLLASRYKNQAPLVYLSGVFFFVGYGGLIFAPGELSWIWVLFVGLGPILFPLNLALFNIRTKSQTTLLRLSGFAQGWGYLIAALGPLMIGLLHELTGSWQASIWFLFGSAIPALIAGTVIARGNSIDEELSRYR